MAHGPHTHPLWGTSTSPLGKVCIATNVFLDGDTQRQEWPLGETGAIIFGRMGDCRTWDLVGQVIMYNDYYEGRRIISMFANISMNYRVSSLLLQLKDGIFSMAGIEPQYVTNFERADMHSS